DLAVPDYQDGLASTLINTGLLLNGMGKRDEALKAYRRAEQIRQRLADAHPAVPNYQHNLALTLYNIASLFALDANRVLKAPGRPAALRDQEVEKLAREVLHHLRLVKKYGYFATPENRSHFAKDAAFAALRGRPDFKAFAASLGKP
ncbi:MAG: hypothetical protein ACRC33_31520, partial [Gemmataceae bacterium]